MTEKIEIQTTSVEPSIRLRFDREDDRWSHRLAVEAGSAKAELMSSLEGIHDQIWPPSPPLQDVSQHALKQGNAVLCVGMAGKSHWSASFSVEGDGQDKSIKADFACLQKERIEDACLGSTYVLGPDCQVQSVTDRRLEVRLNNQQIVEIEALAGDDFATVLELDSKSLEIKPTEISDNPIVATRWGFSVWLR